MNPLRNDEREVVQLEAGVLSLSGSSLYWKLTHSGVDLLHESDFIFTCPNMAEICLMIDLNMWN